MFAVGDTACACACNGDGDVTVASGAGIIAEFRGRSRTTSRG